MVLSVDSQVLETQWRTLATRLCNFPLKQESVDLRSSDLPSCSRAVLGSLGRGEHEVIDIGQLNGTEIRLRVRAPVRRVLGHTGSVDTTAHCVRIDKEHCEEHPLALTQARSASSTSRAGSAFERENPGHTSALAHSAP